MFELEKKVGCPGKQLLIDSNDMRDSDSQLEQRLEETEKQLHASEEAWISLIKKRKWSRREFLTIFDSVPAMIWYRDRQGRILRVNQCAADSVGCHKEELIGANYYELFPDGAARPRQQDLEVIETGQPLRHQIREFRSFDGTVHWAAVDRIPLTDKRADAIILKSKKAAMDQ